MNKTSKLLAVFSLALCGGYWSATHALDLKKYLTQTAPVSDASKAPAGSAKFKPCNTSDLKISMSDMAGLKNPAQSGVIITVENTSKAACTIQGRPDISFLGAWHRQEDIVRQAPRGMMPGPVVLPRTLKVNDVATMPVRWFSKDISGKGRCLNPRKIVMTAPGVKWNAEIKASICGPEKGSVPFDQASFQVKGSPKTF